MNTQIAKATFTLTTAGSVQKRARLRLFGDGNIRITREDGRAVSSATTTGKAITAVDRTAPGFSFAVSGDASYAATLPAGAVIRVEGSTGNDGTYTVATGGASHDTGTVTIPLTTQPPDATVDGYLVLNSTATGGTLVVNSVDLRERIKAGDTIEVTGATVSTGLNRFFTVVSVAFSTNTTITVKEMVCGTTITNAILWDSVVWENVSNSPELSRLVREILCDINLDGTIADKAWS